MCGRPFHLLDRIAFPVHAPGSFMTATTTMLSSSTPRILPTTIGPQLLLFLSAPLPSLSSSYVGLDCLCGVHRAATLLGDARRKHNGGAACAFVSMRCRTQATCARGRLVAGHLLSTEGAGDDGQQQWAMTMGNDNRQRQQVTMMDRWTVMMGNDDRQ